MEIQFVLFGILIFGLLFSVWMIMTSSKRIYNERIGIIQNKVESMGGKINKIDEVDRSDCPLCDDYKDSELSYKFFRFNYNFENNEKEGWAILSMKQNKFGPNGGINAEWMWRF